MGYWTSTVIIGICLFFLFLISVFLHHRHIQPNLIFTNSGTKRKQTVLLITVVSLLVAMSSVLNALTNLPHSETFKFFNFYLIVAMFAGFLLGPLAGMCVGSLGNVIGGFIVPVAGGWYLGFVLSYAIQGFIPGVIAIFYIKYLWKRQLLTIILANFAIGICLLFVLLILVSNSHFLLNLSSSKNPPFWSTWAHWEFWVFFIGISLLILLFFNLILFGFKWLKKITAHYSNGLVITCLLFLSLMLEVILVSFLLNPIWFMILGYFTYIQRIIFISPTVFPQTFINFIITASLFFPFYKIIPIKLNLNCNNKDDTVSKNTNFTSKSDSKNLVISKSKQ